MDDVLAFVRTRLDEDERAALDVAPDRVGPWWVEYRPEKPRWGELQTVSVASSGGNVAELDEEAAAAADLIAHNDSGRALRAAQWKRKVLAELERSRAADQSKPDVQWSHAWLTWCVLQFVTEWSDHEDFRAEWTL